MSNIEKYRKYFTKEYLMGPNSLRLLDELIQGKPADAKFHRTLDLGCGHALTSLYIANETDADHVYAFDLWIPATENYKRIKENMLEDKIIPLHGDAMDMPFAHEYFDAVVSVDSYHYFGCMEGVFAGKILPVVKKGGYVMIAIPGLRSEPQGECKEIFETWAEGEASPTFKTAEWWEELLKKECGSEYKISVKEAECFDTAWQEWFDTEHEFGIRDKEFLSKGLDQVLNCVLIYVRKNEE